MAGKGEQKNGVLDDDGVPLGGVLNLDPAQEIRHWLPFRRPLCTVSSMVHIGAFFV